MIDLYQEIDFKGLLLKVITTLIQTKYTTIDEIMLFGLVFISSQTHILQNKIKGLKYKNKTQTKFKEKKNVKKKMKTIWI